MGSGQARNDQARLLQLLLSTRREAGGSNPPLSLASRGDRHPTTQLRTMNVYYTLTTAQATYHFVANKQIGQARVTKLIRKGGKGYDCSTSMSLDTARRLVRQLQTK